MHYSKCMLAAGLWSVLTISCAQTETDTSQREKAVETENPKTEVDSKAIESYWTKEKMEKAEKGKEKFEKAGKGNEKLEMLENGKEKIGKAGNGKE